MGGGGVTEHTAFPHDSRGGIYSLGNEFGWILRKCGFSLCGGRSCGAWLDCEHSSHGLYDV